MKIKMIRGADGYGIVLALYACISVNEEQEEKRVNIDFCPGRDKMPEEIRKCRDRKQLDTPNICNSCLFRIFEEITGSECRSCDVRQGRIRI